MSAATHWRRIIAPLVFLSCYALLAASTYALPLMGSNLLWLASLMHYDYWPFWAHLGALTLLLLLVSWRGYQTSRVWLPAPVIAVCLLEFLLQGQMPPGTISALHLMTLTLGLWPASQPE